MKANRTGVGNNPPTIELLGDGSAYYNFNIVETRNEDADPVWDYDQVRFTNTSQSIDINEHIGAINSKLKEGGYEEI